MQRVSRHHSLNGSADWGVSDPCTVPRVAEFMVTKGFAPPQVDQLLFDNPIAFYRQCGKFEPRLDLPFVHPSTYQR